MTIAKFAQVTRIQPCVQNLHEWYVQNLHKSLRESAARHPKKAKFGISPPEWRKEGESETLCTNQLVLRLVLRSLGEGGCSA